ncbi:alpha/beta hydrolase [Fluviispira sanaruensis]|uniref:Alpha/beta hydrolase n=1 Tax=Fluviispira sanaruensis TaxID=2493639 RepID=A0A4P2VJN6_FLUSA|nr:alpha/beta hydrolase [Fluviispira sanaruensis]BBH53396.1 alpha/beta hydrolase [Fluviispira sanaruensis]
MPKIFNYIKASELKLYNDILLSESSLQNIEMSKFILQKFIAGEEPQDIRDFINLFAKNTNANRLCEIIIENINIFGTQIRFYSHKENRSEKVILHFHSGGFVIGSSQYYDNLFQYIARKSGAAILSIDYKLAPEHKFPYALNQCVELCKEILTNGIQNKISAQSEFYFLGDSAGGNLAANMSHLLGDTYTNIAGQILIYPVLCPVGTTFSYHKFSNGFSLETEHMNIFMSYYLNSAEEKNSKNPKIYPYYFDHFASLPKTMIIAGECDPLRDDAYLYAQKCYENNIEFKYYEFAGTVHGFFSALDSFPEARISADLVCDFISEISDIEE